MSLYILMIKISQIWPVGATEGWPLCHSDISPPFSEHFLTSRLWRPRLSLCAGGFIMAPLFLRCAQGIVYSAGGQGGGGASSPVTGVLSSLMIHLTSCPSCCWFQQQSSHPESPCRPGWKKFRQQHDTAQASTLGQAEPLVFWRGSVFIVAPVSAPSGPFLDCIYSLGILRPITLPGDTHPLAQVSLVPVFLSCNPSKCPCSPGTVALIACLSSSQDVVEPGSWRGWSGG